MASAEVFRRALARRSYGIALGIAVSCYAALGAIIRIIPGYVGGELRGAAFAVGLAVGAPAIAAVFARPFGGGVADRLGARRVVVAGALTMALGALPMFAHAYRWFLLARLVTGLGEGAMMSATVLWLLRLAGPERRGRALGHVGLANYAGLALGPLIADALGGSGHASRVFLAAAVLPVLCLPLLHLASEPQPQPLAEGGGTRGRDDLVGVARAVWRAGVGLLLVNVGYVTLLSFGGAAVGGASVAVIPLYAVTVIVVRTLGGGLPDRCGGARTLAAAAPLAAAGLLMVALLPPAGALAGVLVLGVGQALAVPALGLIALRDVSPERYGLAAGAFFSWFDAGVGLGGPFAGAMAGLGGSGAALSAAAGAVAFSPAVGIAARRRRKPGTHGDRDDADSERAAEREAPAAPRLTS
ncbi:MAG: MFS transporter [Solirubrobacteraceae bacterium]